jgi:hypothetical protein
MIILSYIIHKWEGLFCRRAQCLIYVICVCLRIVVSNTYCVVFVYVYWCPTHIVLCFCFVYLRLVCPVLPGSLECPFWITPSCCQVLWNVHSGLPLRVARFSGLSILDYPFVLPGSLDCPFFITPSVSLTFIETHKKIFFLSLWQTNRRIEQIYKDFG